MKTIKTTLTKTITAKTTMMGASMNALLNTISAQITYTRGALIALFAGLFILAACGGGAPTTDVAPTGTGTDICETNGYSDGCGEAGEATRARVINACIDAIKTGGACDANIPTEVLDCLNEPFTVGCTNEVLQTTTVTIAAVQTKRTDDCRGGNAGSAACTGAIVNVCGDVTSTKDGVLFTETLCGDEYNARRSTLVNDCRTGVEAGQTRDDACADVVIATDTDANEKALDCVLDAFAEGCDTNDDVKNVVEKTDETVKPIEETKTDIRTVCLGADDFATNPLCPSAIKATCASDPFTQTTTSPPVDFCSAELQTARVKLCREASDFAANPLCPTAIQTACAADPFTQTIGDSPADFCSSALQDARVKLCREASDFAQNPLCPNAIQTRCEADPFTQTIGDSPTDFCNPASRTAFITRCTDADENNNAGCDTVNVSGGATVVTVANCATNPYAPPCSDDAFNGLKDARYNHCIGETPTLSCALVETNVICVADAAKASDRANPFHVICRNAGTYASEQTRFCTARTDENRPECAPGLITTCADNPFADICTKVDFYTTDRETVVADCALATPTAPDKCTFAIEGGGTVAACITDPFDKTNGCDDSDDFEATRIARTSLCTPSATFFDGLCDTFAEIDTTRDGICNTQATSFHAGCLDRKGGGDAEQAREAFVIACRIKSDATGCDTPITEDSSLTVGDCATNPYRDICKDDANFADEKGFRTSFCADATEYFNGLCDVAPDIDTTRETHCITPATSFDANCDDRGYAVLDERREAFALTCRGNPNTPGCDEPADGDSGTLTIADCSNGANGDPYKALCVGLSGFDKEAEERAKECGAIAVLESNRCENAKLRNDCVNNPFAVSCDLGVYQAAQTNRDSYCTGAGIATDNTLCTDRKAHICDGTQMTGNPFATLCGDDNHAQQIDFCTLTGKTDGICSNAAAAATPTACHANPFDDSFGAYELDCTDIAYYEHRRPTCLGTIDTLMTAGVELADCAVLNVADVICGADTLGGDKKIGTNPFAEICGELSVTNVITGFDKLTEQRQFCGNTRISAGIHIGDCETIYNGLCAGADLFAEMAGAGEYDCLNDGEYSGVREGICTTPATSFNPGCKDGTHGTVLATRKNLAMTCRTPQSGNICDTRVNGSDDSGLTVEECNGATGDPFQEACRANAELLAAFDDERKERAAFCSAGALVTNDLFCKNAREYDTCIHFPYGKVTDNSADCDPMKYEQARTNRETHCRNSDGTGICVNIAKALCDGIGENDNPFSVACDRFNVDNSEAQNLWCGNYGDDAKCANNHSGACLERPFGEVVIARSGDKVNCLTHGGGATYALQRLLFCAEGRQGVTSTNCDTDIIAPVVCGTSEGENSNPFADFCDAAVNDEQDADALFATRQGTVAFCAMSENSAKPVCVNAGADILALDVACRDGAESVTARCNYKKYSTTQMEYCTTPGSVDIFDPNCKQDKHGEVDDARETECRKTGSVLFKNVESCTKIVADRCNAGGTSVLQSRTAASGYLCQDKSGTAYADAREVLCGVSGTGIEPNTLIDICKPTLARICMGKEFTTAGMAGYNCAENDAFNGVREAACGVIPTVSDSNCMATRLRLCTDENGMSLVQTASNGYDCSASRIDTVLAERRRFCANPEGGDTTGCPTVLAGLCTGEKSFMNGVATGGGVTHNCKDDMHQLVIDERQAYCALDGKAALDGCPAVLTTLCTGEASLGIEVSTGTVTGTNYSCAGSEVPDVVEARETLCQIRGNGDGLCTNTIKNFCGMDDDNPHPTNDIFDLLCRADYETARDNFCADDADYQNTDCDREGRKTRICDGDQPTDKPYADVCGPGDTNLVGQTAFCRIDDHSTSEMKCRATIVTVCDVTDGDPFDMLCPTGDNTDRQTRATACFGENPAKSGDDCKDVATCNADPFGADCDDTIYLTARTDHCETPMTSFTVGCMDDRHGNVTEAQKGYCAGDVERHQNCPALLAKVCMGENSLMNDVPTGHPSVDYDCKNDITTERVINERQAHCADPKGGVTTGCPDVLTMLCTGENSLSDTAPTGVTGTTFDCAAGETYRPQKREYCARDGKDGTGDCPSVITTLCEDDKSVQIEVATGVDSRNYNCSTSTVANVVSAREDFCRENTANNLCTTTIVGLCSDNEFELKADGENYVCGDELIGEVNYQEKREATCKTKLEDSDCTPTIERVCGTAIVPAIDSSNFKNPLCSGSDYTAERGKICSEISEKTERETECGLEDGNGDLAAFCNTSVGANDPDVCPLTYGDPERRACIDTNPFAVTCNEEFHDNRVSACVADDKMADTSNCASTVVLICEGGINGDDTITANPFHTLCNKGTTYDKARLTLCEGDPANLPSGDVTLCKDTDLSGAICGTGEDSASTHGSNPYAEICNKPEALINNFDLTVARGTFCTEFSYNNNCIDNAAVKWKDTALDKDGEPGLNVLSAGDADGITNTAIDENNPVTNYILGQTDGLNLGFDQTVVPNTITNLQKGGLKLEVLDTTYAGTGNGVAFAAFTNTEDTTSQQKFYAGLLSNTDLGGLLTAETTISTIWKARAAIIVGTNAVVTDDDFTLEVIFGEGENTIRTRAGDAIEFGNNISFVIAGKFNAAGVIFGETTYTNSDTSTTSTGSLTGLIGEYGAVGAFISDISNAAGDFAGGFVADNPNEGTIDCLATGIPFNKTACPNAGDLRAELCRKRVALTPSGLPLDFNVMTDCVGDSDIMDAICARRGISANPFDAEVCMGRDQTGNQLAFVDNCAKTDKTDLDGATCLTPIPECIADPFDPGQECGGAEYANVKTTRTEFCAFDATPFDGKCVNVPNINVVRGKACAEGLSDDSMCGTETGVGDGIYIKAYCADDISANDVANCGKKYEDAQTAVTAVSPTTLDGKALNAKGTDLLEGVAVSGAAIDTPDKDTNFITAGTATLDFGIAATATTRTGDLTLDELANSDLATSGFAFAQGTFTSGEKLYVGLLNTTDLGAPLNDTAKDGDWKAKLSVLTATGEPVTADFILVVNFTDKDLTVKAADLDVGDLGIISIAGKFTVNGVIYGTVNFATAGVATLTGLIGTNGAVGIFASDSNTDYVGGFVAAYIDCSETGTPFDATCADDSPAQLSVCRGTIDALMSAGGQIVDCKSDALSGRICGMGLAPGDDPFAKICDQPTALVDDFDLTVARQVACAGETIASPSSDCMPVIRTLCTEQPFNATAGAGAMTIDCTTGETYKTQRESRITTCKDYVMGTTPENLLCEQAGVTAITASCPANPFASACAPYAMQYASERSQRITDCSDDTAQEGLECSGTRDVVCAPTGTPVSVVCKGYEGNSETITAVRQEFCRDPLNSVDSRCTPIRKAFCDPLIGSNDILSDDLCTDAAGTYNVARGAQCAETASAGDALALDPKCGTEGGADTYLQAFCDTGDGGLKEIHCPLKAAKRTAWVNGAKLNTGTLETPNLGKLTILGSVGVDDAETTNYVQADADGLEIDGDVDVSGDNTIIDTLMLSEAGTTDAPGSGVAFARIDYADFTAGSKVKYYAGILSGTDLGGPVATSNSATVVEWDLVLSIVLGNRAVEVVRGIKLAINFKDRRFQRVTQSLQKRPGATIGIASEGFEARKVFIEGGFTTEGIIYGTTKIGPNRNTIVAKGTLTGLIGNKGAVAAFVSDGTTGGAANQFAGGFVADNPKLNVVCTLASGNAFDTSKCLVATRAALCRDRNGVSVTDIQCQTAEIRGVICVAPGEGEFANVFDSICDTGNGGDYTALRISLRCTTTGNYASLVDKICDGGAHEAAREAAFCVDLASGAQANPFHPVCLDPMVADMYDVFRQTACAGQPVDAPSGGRTGLDARCNDPIIKLCEAEPFNPTAGAGDTKFDCLGASDNNYVMARQVEIGLCVNGEQTDKERGICSDSEVMKITTPCGDDPFASACTDYAEQYMMQRETRLIACRLADKGDSDCTNAISTICTTGDTPFADICHRQLGARKSVVGACLAVVIANEEATASDIRTKEGALLLQPIPASCSVMVVAGKTVLECINDPFNSECDVDTIQTGYCPTRLREAQCQKSFYAATAKICETSTTSFTAECLDPANGFVGVRQLSETATSSRALLVARCSDTLADGMPNTTNDDGCDTVIAEGSTPTDNIKLADCIKNPFRTECQGVAVAFALANSKDAVEIRDTLVTGCVGMSDPVAGTPCATIVGGARNIEFCTRNPFDADCSGDTFAAAFNRFRAPTCTTAATSFNAGCTEEEYSVTEEDEVTIKYRDTARAERALGCADAKTKGQNGCDTPVSGVAETITIDGCNADPFATGCESAAFINARLEACKAGSTDPACSVATATATAQDSDVHTGYVSGLENGLASLYATNKEDRQLTDLDETYNYVKDNPATIMDESAVYEIGTVATKEVQVCTGEEPSRVCDMVTVDVEDDPLTPLDESRVQVQDTLGTPLDESKKRIIRDDSSTYLDERRALLYDNAQANVLNLSDVGYANTDLGVYTDQSASGFALVYIPEVREPVRYDDGQFIQSTVTIESRYYAGLLAATDVGPEFHNATGIAEWAGKLSLVNKGVLSDVADFTLDINFDTRTIGASDERTHTTYKIETYRDDFGVTQERSVADKSFPVKVDYAHTTLGQFFINGKFTTKGVIYGTTKLVNDGGFRITEPTAENGLTEPKVVSVLGEESSRGTLTGVIGQNGAVGAFVSSGSGNTFGEYAGGFVAAPGLNCGENPLDIRCNEQQHYAAREDACSGSMGWRNPACDPVFERVCNEEEDNLFLSNAMVDGTMGLDCLHAPNHHEDRKYTCSEKIGYVGGPVPDVCTTTVDKVCMDTLFDDLTICHRVAKYQDMQYTACSDGAVINEIFNRSTTSTVAEKCFGVISPDCSADPFDSRFCYLSDNYNDARVDKCSDHNFAAIQPACTTETTITGATTGTVNVIGDYCHEREAADDDYNLCDNTGDYVLWRNAGNKAVTGWNAAKANDFGLIAGGKSKLNLGARATSIDNEMTLFLGDSTTNGVAIASATVDGQLQFYGGLLSGADVGAPVTGVSGAKASWTGEVALLWQNASAEAVLLTNDNFVIELTYGDSSTLLKTAVTTLSGTDSATFTINGSVTNGEKLATGTTNLSVPASGSVDAPFRGLIGADGILAAFATHPTVGNGRRTGRGAYAGVFFAKDLRNACLGNGAGNPFSSSACKNDSKQDPQRLAEATRCYANGASISDRPTNGDCNSLLSCFDGKLFSGGDQDIGGSDGFFNIACDKPAFDGARAIFCGNNPANPTCVKLDAGERVVTVNTKDSETDIYNLCIGTPLREGCADALGVEAIRLAGFKRATHCMMGDNVESQGRLCSGFITAVQNCRRNPFGNQDYQTAAEIEAGTAATARSCEFVLNDRIGAGFADKANELRLAHCNANPTDGDLCSGALTHCAVSLPETPDTGCGTLVANYCLGAEGRTIKLKSDACTEQIATVCDANPFDNARCKDAAQTGYATARLEYCEGDGMTGGDTGLSASVSLAKCQAAGLDLTICGNGSNKLGTNPFAEVCKTLASNRNFDSLSLLKSNYCSQPDSVTFTLAENQNCTQLVMATCGTDELNPIVDNALDPLCHQEIYNYAKVQLCSGAKPPAECGTQKTLATLCPPTGERSLGCPATPNSTPTSVWVDNALSADGESALGIRARGSIAIDNFPARAFVQADREGLDLTTFYKDGIVASGFKDGVAVQTDTLKFAPFEAEDDAVTPKGGITAAIVSTGNNSSQRYYAGLLLGTDVGGPIRNNSADGLWRGVYTISRYRILSSSRPPISSFSRTTDFTATVSFNGKGGTITTPGGPNVLKINARFNLDGVIYGVTSIYSLQNDADNRNIGTITGLIGKTGAAAVFMSTGRTESDKAGHPDSGQYVGGFVLTPDTAYVGSADCTATGTPLDLVACPAADYSAELRAEACNKLASFDGNARTVCKMSDVQNLVCTDTGAYANPFNLIICVGGDNDIRFESLAPLQLAVANGCDADSTSTAACKTSFVADCLTNPYDSDNSNGPSCSDNLAFADIRMSRETFCGMAGSGDDAKCVGTIAICILNSNDPNCVVGPVRTCLLEAGSNASCGDIVSAYCFAEARRTPSLCAGTIQSACLNVNPFNPRCTDTLTDALGLDDAKMSFCSSQSIAKLDELGAHLTNDCSPHAVAICGFYIPYQALAGPKVIKGGVKTGTGIDIQAGRVYGTNPYAAICVNSDANPDGTDRDLGVAGNTYDRDREGAGKHANEVLAYYVREFCPVIPSNNKRIDSCPKIDIAGADGYEAWGRAVGQGLISAGGAGLPSVTETTSFIAGYGGGLYLGVGNTNVANSKTFRLNAGANGFAYATTGTQLFTGLLSGTTNLGAPLGAEIVNAEWRSTLSFLTNQSGVITAIEKEGFTLTLNYNGGASTIIGTENVGTGMVFEVAGTFTGNLLSGTVIFGEGETDDSKVFKTGGLQSTGRLTGVIGAEGVIGVFTSNARGHFGDFVGGFIGAPATDATNVAWRLSFVEEEGKGNFLTKLPTGDNRRVKLYPSGIDIAHEITIADGANSFIRLNAEDGNEINVANAEFVLYNPMTKLVEVGSESALNALDYGTDDNGQGLAVESSGTIRRSLAFFNDSRLETPDNGASGVSFGQFKSTKLDFVRLAGLWPTTNMGLPLTAQPTKTIWRGSLSAVYNGAYTGEKDARFTITYTGAGGTIETTERVFVAVAANHSNYILIDAKFDSFGAISGETSVTSFVQDGGVDLPGETTDLYAGRVSGLIGAKGLIGAFVSNFDSTTAYAGGFYALNPNAKIRAVAAAVRGPTSRGVWTASFDAGGFNDLDSENDHNSAHDDANNPLAVNAFGAGAPNNHARFARRGTGFYIAEDKKVYDTTYPTDFEKMNNPRNSRALLVDFADDNVDDNGVGLGKVGNQYYSGLLAGADAGLSLSKNQLITTAATWSGKIALYGVGSGANSTKPVSTEQVVSLEVTFDGTAGTINTITGNLPTFGGSFREIGKLIRDYTLEITATFNVAGVIKGTTSFYGLGNNSATAVEGVVTGLIGTRGAIGSFISTKVFASETTTAGTYAGGFVVRNPDYTVLPELQVSEQAELGDDVELTSWATASGASTTKAAGSNGYGGDYRDLASATHFIEGTDTGITNIQTQGNGGGIRSRMILNTLELTDVKKESAGGVVFAVIDNINDHHFAGLLSTADVGKALLSPPPTAVWAGKLRGILGVALSAEVDFYLHVSFNAAGDGKVKSSNANGDAASIAFVNNSTLSFSGSFTSAGVMSGRVTTTGNQFTIAQGGGDFNGIIGEKGALGVFKSDGVGRYAYVGGFTAQNPNFDEQGVTADYNLWRVSFNSRGVNRQVTHPIITDTKLANPLHPRGVNVNQFVTGTTHFVQGELNGLNLTGSSVVTGGGFTPTVLRLESEPKVGFALWYGDINVVDETKEIEDHIANTQGYVGLLSSADVGADPLVAGRTTYTGKIIAYVGSELSDETDFTLNINYGDNRIDAVATLLETEFRFDGGFNFLGVISGKVLIGADGVPGSFNGLLGTKSAIGVFKNTLGSAGKTFIGGFAVSDKFVNSPDWAESFGTGANAEQTLLRSARDDRTAGTHFISATAAGIRGTSAEENLLYLTADDLDGGVAFVQESGAGYTGLLSTTNVGLPLELPTEDEDISAVWNGAIQAYVGGVLSGKSGFNLMVDFMEKDVDGVVTLGGKKFTFDGDFTDKGIMSGDVLIGESGATTTEGSFNGLIGVLGAAGAFKNNVVNTEGTFVGGFVVTPVLDTDDKVNFDDWVNSGVSGLLADGAASTETGTFRQGFFIRGSDADITGIEANTRILTLTSDANSGVAFGHRPKGSQLFEHQTTYYAGLLEGTDVGRRIENKNLNGVWKGRIRSYVLDGTLADAVDFFLDVEFGAFGLTGNEVGKVRSTSARTGGTKGAIPLGHQKGNIDINGTFNAAGVMSGAATHEPYANNDPVTSNGTFTGLIGTLGAVGVFKDNGNGRSGQPDAFLGGFFAEPIE
ncbi:MAG: beta strand repeat-containing protein [Candidatus Halichondribacter symbioticus]